MNDPRVPSDPTPPQGAESPNLKDSELDELSEDLLDQVSGGVTSGGGPS